MHVIMSMINQQRKYRKTQDLEKTVKDMKNRLDLLEMDLKKLEKNIKEDGSYGTPEEWHHVLQKVRKIEEFAISQLAIRKYLEEHK